MQNRFGIKAARAVALVGLLAGVAALALAGFGGPASIMLPLLFGAIFLFTAAPLAAYALDRALRAKLRLAPGRSNSYVQLPALSVAVLSRDRADVIRAIERERQ